MTWNLPNILTVLRLLAAPALGLVFLGLAAPYAEWIALLLFIGASLTDWVDGYLARAWKQESRFGAMLDPIADKAMVLIAIVVLAALSGLDWLILMPCVLIVFREVFVSGLREFLGADAKLLKVTKLAKWKTTVQMVAISVLFARALFEHYLGMQIFGMDEATVTAILDGDAPDTLGIGWKVLAVQATGLLGVALLWLAAVLTVITGWDYFSKALPFLQDGERP
ncbi:CDP-diacylglycerol--glycerol-3-phosphate 3-phosphatidyltransferase [Pseudoruegeria sp. SHC-113]|uniref:CDP-diacylglycerol--glycerol-3-phosphate 3-phosphatidyltransferase n=1 Tax=Pseudoruegeria sp. SHC-113 TaxID=2855439 RepID=UPI0021BAD323|nr:CDP-diacylglycerol--glycerol-3-phosphate 3-phosphatidyltransferase [Pseudoruegeria sp. SHC-113]MCT8161661.1 CDP-diacylglycerol--glycerol-3-phosphate 3-phosphatidyltransferase [Pseudoruegeria sp. SHC-113]